MAELFERLARPLIRAAVDRMVGEPSGAGRWTLVGVWAAVVVVVAVLLSGLVNFGGQTTGPLPVDPSGAGTQVQFIATQLQLTDRAHVKPIEGLSAVDAPTRAWIDREVCKKGFARRIEREVRAWRMDQNPTLCGAFDTLMGQAPLNVALGPWLGMTLAAIILLGLTLPLLALLLWLPRVRKAYRRLYVSDHRLDRLKGEAR